MSMTRRSTLSRPVPIQYQRHATASAPPKRCFLSSFRAQVFFSLLIFCAVVGGWFLQSKLWISQRSDPLDLFSFDSSLSSFQAVELVRQEQRTFSPTTRKKRPTHSPSSLDVPLEEEDPEEEEEDPVELEDEEDSNNSLVPLPDYSQEELAVHGLGNVLYVYRVVAESVAIRTKPSPIGSLLGVVGSESAGLIRGAPVKRDEILVGYQISTNFGLWLRLGPKHWAPITKKRGEMFVTLMKQIRRITIPFNLKRYWGMKKCIEESDAQCRDTNMIRDGVLQVLRRTELLLPSMDPDYIPITTASPTSLTTTLSENDQWHQACQAQNSSISCTSDSHCIWAKSQTCVLKCRELSSWFHCVKHPTCSWVHRPNDEFCDLDSTSVKLESVPVELAHDLKYDFVSPSPTTSAKYFIYQPSGGWNNQRLLLENALVICMLLNRTCIAPPASPHSNFFRNYNSIPINGVTGMSRVLNFAKLNEIVSLQTIPQTHTFESFMNQELFPKLSVRTVIRDVSRYKPGTMKKWSERDIIKMFQNDTSSVLYFANQTMWGTMEWKGTMGGWSEKKSVQLHMMPPNHMKSIARQLAELMGPYHAVHLRRGDKIGEANFLQVSHPPNWWAERINSFRTVTNKVYIATDEAKRDYFDVFSSTYKLDTVFFETLPGYDTIVRPYLSHFPNRMSMDVLGMIEQLLCTYANLFLGSGYSTFTTFILRLRKYRTILGVDTSFEDPLLSLPASIREEESSCDPLQSLTHSKPC